MIDGDYTFPSDAVIRQLGRAIHEYVKPQSIRVDNGLEFACSTFVDRCEQMDITTQYIQPGKPMQNGHIEQFNRTFLEDILDAYIFEDIYQFIEIKNEWMENYNNHRPHEALNNPSPVKYCSA